jgi:glutaminase
MIDLETLNLEAFESDLIKIYDSLKGITGGKNADYIPALAKVDPKLYAISVFTVDGREINIGDFKHEFAIESCSKIFTLALALEKFGTNVVKTKIGATSSDKAFNSICAVEETDGHTINSFNNSGAMATLSLLQNNKMNQQDLTKKVVNNMSQFAARTLRVNQKIFASEFSHAEHNLAIAYLLKSNNRFYGDVFTTVNSYTHQCSAMVTSYDVAIMAATLANFGLNPKTNKRLVSITTVEYILDHMLVAGLYNDTDNWLTKVGLHAKSGVSGILLIVVPGIMGISIISPPLNKYGNSFKGIKTAAKIAKLFLKKGK